MKCGRRTDESGKATLSSSLNTSRSCSATTGRPSTGSFDSLEIGCVPCHHNRHVNCGIVLGVMTTTFSGTAARVVAKAGFG